MRKPNVAFICVHNSCRSQMAEALGRKLASDVFDSFSAGTETKPQINQDAVRLMKQVHGIDMEKISTVSFWTSFPGSISWSPWAVMSSVRFFPVSIGRTGGLTTPAARMMGNFLRPWG